MLTKELEVVFCEKFCLLDGRLVGKKKEKISIPFFLFLFASQTRSMFCAREIAAWQHNNFFLLQKLKKKERLILFKKNAGTPFPRSSSKFSAIGPLFRL
jgi:hypothetical protein